MTAPISHSPNRMDAMALYNLTVLPNSERIDQVCGTLQPRTSKAGKMWLLLPLVFCVFVSLPTTAQTPIGMPLPGFHVENGVTYTGNTPILASWAVQDSSNMMCEAMCAGNPNCKAYTYVRANGYTRNTPPVCYLFSGYGPKTNNSCCISGTKGGAPPPPPLPQIAFAGRWLFRGVSGQNALIEDLGNGRLKITTEKGLAGGGSVESGASFLFSPPYSATIRGVVTPDGSRINWSNGEFWTRQPVQATIDKPLPPINSGTATCANVKGPWYVEGNQSGLHFWMDEPGEPGTWQFGGGEANRAWPEHNDRWGTWQCVATNTYRLTRRNGVFFTEVTLGADGKFHAKDGMVARR